MKELKMKELNYAKELNDMALKLWHHDNSFEGRVVFHMDLFSDWYSDTDPLEIVKRLSHGFDANKPHLIISTDNKAYSLDDEEFIEHVFKMRRSILKAYEHFIK